MRSLSTAAKFTRICELLINHRDIFKAFVGFVVGIYTRSPAQHESGTEEFIAGCLLPS
jgi:hypothetical protein